MRVSVLYLAGCPNWRDTGRRLRQALDQLGHTSTEISLVPVEAEAEEAAAGFRGSPTITVDGEDLFADGDAPSGVSCRVYSTASGPVGVPGMADLVTALRARIGR